jgi:hypothetical protein
MSELSPAAQAVLDAFVSNAGEGHRHQSGAAAAALRAAADQVVPEERKPSADSDYHLMNWTKALDTYYQRKQTRAEILAIAAELESH